MAEIPQELLELKFDLKDCVVETPRHTGKKDSPRGLLFGVHNGEYDQAGEGDPEDPSAIARRITITHLPTKLSISVDKFMPKRNREIAAELLKSKVEKWIADAIAKFKAA